MQHHATQFVLPEDLKGGDELKAAAFGFSDSGAMDLNHAYGNAHFEELWGKFGIIRPQLVARMTTPPKGRKPAENPDISKNKCP